eukprot:m.52576 g.52576  ORF g.52576 m.52576 type:complete len:225 (-) comp13511_c0_seq2:165-839(-)
MLSLMVKLRRFPSAITKGNMSSLCFSPWHSRLPAQANVSVRLLWANYVMSVLCLLLACFQVQLRGMATYKLRAPFGNVSILSGFDENIKKFRDLNTEVILMSVDSPYALLAWTQSTRKEGGLGAMNIPLASDLTHSISKDYGVLLKDAGHSLRGLFIIDDKGILRQVTMNDLPVGRSVEETLRLVQAFQHTDEHGTVCPSNWHPGDDTIVPDPEGKLEYFQKKY